MLTVNGAADSTFAGVISGQGGLTQAGSNTLTLTASNTYTGPTAVNAGRLLLSGGSNAVLASPVTVNSGGILGGDGLFNGGITVAAGGQLSPGLVGTTSTVSVASLNLQAGVRSTSRSTRRPTTFLA